MEKKIVEVRTLKVGKYILIDGVPCKIQSMTHSKPGKHGGARVRIDAMGIFEDTKKSMIKPASDKAEVPMMDKRTAQVLAVVGDKLQMMDMESYETFEMPMPDDAEIKSFIKEGAEVMYLQWSDKKKITQAKGGD
ncbi:MAG: translation initiation factor IF-5A [Candidatus Altiarchaeales archaeon]|nr:translation initiation factor IF-5A [Candidatus Altiarchaeales archaeon]MBD3416228.1 translation initiation factor IF-5A [Candidatus Altiarchaeales archaeon]